MAHETPGGGPPRFLPLTAAQYARYVAEERADEAELRQQVLDELNRLEELWHAPGVPARRLRAQQRRFDRAHEQWACAAAHLRHLGVVVDELESGP